MRRSVGFVAELHHCAVQATPCSKVDAAFVDSGRRSAWTVVVSCWALLELSPPPPWWPPAPRRPRRCRCSRRLICCQNQNPRLRLRPRPTLRPQRPKRRIGWSIGVAHGAGVGGGVGVTTVHTVVIGVVAAAIGGCTSTERGGPAFLIPGPSHLACPEK